MALHDNLTEWKNVSGGKRPTAPPCVFPGMPKSCLNQASSHVRSTSCLKQASSHVRSTSGTSEKRAQNDAERAEIFTESRTLKSF